MFSYGLLNQMHYNKLPRGIERALVLDFDARPNVYGWASVGAPACLPQAGRFKSRLSSKGG